MLKKLSNQNKIWVATAFCFLFMFAEALTGNIFSTLQPFIIEHYGTSLTESSLFSMSGQIGHLLIMYLIMIISDRIDKVKLLAVLGLFLGACSLGIGTAPSMGALIILLAMRTMLESYLDNTCTAYISNMWGDQRGHYIGMMFVLFVIGMSIAPNLNTFVIENLKLGWNASYTITGAFCVVVTLCYIFVFTLMKRPVLEIDKVSWGGEKKRLSVKEMLKNRNMKALFLANITLSFYMYFSSQLPVFFFMTNADVFDTKTRSLIATAGSIGSIVSRVLYVPLSKKLKTISYLRVQSLTSVLFNVIGLVFMNPYVWMVCLFLSNCISGASYTARTVLTCDEYPEYASSASAATSVANGIAGLFATPLMNWVADSVSFIVAMIIPLIFGVGTYFVFKFVYVERNKGDEVIA